MTICRGLPVRLLRGGQPHAATPRDYREAERREQFTWLEWCMALPPATSHHHGRSGGLSERTAVGTEQHAASAFLGTSPGSDPAPTPIPGGFNARDAFGPRFPDRFFHLFLPGQGTEPSTIFNFHGKLAILNIHGTGTRTDFDPQSGQIANETPNLPFATDVRFMQGTYVGADGQQHQATFAFF